MKIKDQFSVTRKVLHLIMALGIFLSTFSGANLQSVRAQDGVIEIPTAQVIEASSSSRNATRDEQTNITISNYVDPEFGFSSNYPQGWITEGGQVVDPYTFIWEVSFVAPEQSYRAIVVDIQPVDRSVSLQNWVTIVLESFGLDFRELSISGAIKEITVNGEQAIQVQFPSNNVIYTFVISPNRYGYSISLQENGDDLSSPGSLPVTDSMHQEDIILYNDFIQFLRLGRKISQIKALEKAKVGALALATADSFRFPLDSANWKFNYNLKLASWAGTSTCFGTAYANLFHAGQDWGNSPGTPVKAVANGTVEFYNPNYITYPGRVVVLKHLLPDGSSVYSTYGHLETAPVYVGQIINKGDTIGTVTSWPGLVSNSHVHWEIRYFADGSDHCINGTSGYYGPGYTYPNYPDNYGYTNPETFVNNHQGGGNPCYTLTLSNFGSGSVAASPANSVGCSNGQYHAGESINLNAYPATGWHLESWSGTDGASSSHLTMPSSSRWVVANFVQDTTTSCPSIVGEVRLYDLTNCGGGYATANDIGGWNLGTFNDRAESIVIPNGWSVRLFQNDPANINESICFAATDPNLNDNLFYNGGTVGNQVTLMAVYDNSGCIDNSPPVTPANFRVSSSTQTSITIAWDDVSDETGYDIFKWNGLTQTFDYLASVGANVTSYTETRSSCGWDEYYEVSAYNSYGNSIHANWVHGNAQACPPPSANFDAWPQSGNAPFTTAFHIVNMENITSCHWDYGDGQTSSTCTQLHNHVYNNPGLYSITFTASGPGGWESGTRTNYINVTSSAKPDLIVQSITASPSSPPINQAVTFTVRVKNQGTAAISSLFYVDLFIDAAPGSCPTDGIAFWEISSLAVGATQDLVYNYAGFSTSGTHNLYVIADSYCSTTESNEGNNILGPVAISINQPQTLTVSKAGAGSGTVTSSPVGINCGVTCSYAFTYNTLVTLTATPTSPSTFGGWSGAGCSGTGTCTVTMNTAQYVTATFNSPGTQTLTVSKAGVGSGTVTSSPAGINCGITCSYAFANTSVVTLTAIPTAPSTFGGWSGAGCSGTGTCIVTMNTAQLVTATFNQNTNAITAQFPISQGIDDAGVHYGCGSATNYSEVYFGKCANGSSITTGFRFANVTIPPGSQIISANIKFTVDGTYNNDIGVTFNGELSGNAQSFSIASMPSARALTNASTNWPIPASDVWMVSQNRTSPDIGNMVQEIVNRTDWSSGNALAIIARDASAPSTLGSHRRVFAYERAGSPYAAQLVVIYTNPIPPVALTVSKIGTGSGVVTSLPTGINCGVTCSYAFAYNAVVTLTATPAAGSTFTGWSGAGCTGTGSCTVTMSSAQSVTATFAAPNAGGGSTTGVFRPSNGLLYLKNANTTGFADVAINYGTAGDYPVAGDWDGNGTATIGIYRNGFFYLRNSNTLGFADIVFAFGTPGDQPVAGDWDGDGVDTIGVYSNGQFLLRNTNTSGPPNMSFYLGNPGDVGIAGDWNGDGLDTTGVFRPSNGIIFLKNANSTGFADVALNYGMAGDMPVTGDWNNDGIDTIGVYRNAQFLLRNSNTIGFAEIVFGLGNPGDMPISGNWDGIP